MKIKTAVCGVALLFVVAACDFNLGDTVGPSQTQNVVVDQSGGQDANAQLPTDGVLPEGSTIAISIFDQTCDSGTPPSGKIGVGCVATLTATPKDGNGVPLDAAVHGPDISWSVVSGAASVIVTDHENPFNKVVRGVSPGLVTFEVRVKDVTSRRTFEVS